MPLSYIEILHIYVVIDRQLQESEQRGPPLTQLAFRTVNSLSVPSHKNWVRKVRRTRWPCNGPTLANAMFNRCAINQMLISEYYKLYSSIVCTQRITTNICQSCMQSDHMFMMFRDTSFYSVMCSKVASDITIVYVQRRQWHNYLFPTYGYVTTNVCFGLLYLY